MYTTLAMLKGVSACRDGFSTQLAFWGTGAAVRDQRIPLHALILTADCDDAVWALEHGAVINPTEYEDLFKRTSLDMWRRLLLEHKVYAAVNNMTMQAFSLKTAAELKEKNKGRPLTQMQLRTQRREEEARRARITRLGARGSNPRDDDDEGDTDDDDPVDIVPSSVAKYKNPGYAYYRRAVACNTWAEVEVLMNELSYMASSLELWKVVNNMVWRNRSAYITRLIGFVRQSRPQHHAAYLLDDKEVEHQMFDYLYKDVDWKEDERAAHLLKPTGTYDFLFELKLNEKRLGARVLRDEGTREFVFRVEQDKALALVKEMLRKNNASAVISEADADWGDTFVATTATNTVNMTLTNVSTTTTQMTTPPVRTRPPQRTVAPRTQGRAIPTRATASTASGDSSNSDSSNSDSDDSQSEGID